MWQNKIRKEQERVAHFPGNKFAEGTKIKAAIISMYLCSKTFFVNAKDTYFVR